MDNKLDEINSTLKILVDQISEKKSADTISKIFDKLNKQETILAKHTIILNSLPQYMSRLNIIEKQQITWKGVIIGATGIGTIISAIMMILANYFKNN